MGCGASIDTVNEEKPSTNRVVAPRLPSLQQQPEAITKPSVVGGERFELFLSTIFTIYFSYNECCYQLP